MTPEEFIALKSDRQLPLVYQSGYNGKPVLTVELYCKWYSYYLVHQNGEIESIEFHHDENFDRLTEESLPPLMAGDHIPFPSAYKAICLANDWTFDQYTYEFILGRWIDEHGFAFELIEPKLRKSEENKC